VKNHQIVKNSTTAEAMESTRIDLESSDFKKNFHVGFTKFKNTQNLNNKISPIFLVKRFISVSLTRF
jgi:hypothetical protein